ncbi:hypothetical protein FJ366_02555 [Candidatus Dependentiae bacterium]|nr:hypothetical protein [Candidatus Dependentiae bacterium]
MKKNQLSILVGILMLAGTGFTQVPKPESYATIRGMLAGDAYLNTDKSLPGNASKEAHMIARMAKENLSNAIMDIFTHGLVSARKRKPAEMIFPESLLRDARFFCDSNENTVFSHIDKTFTQSGKITLATTLAEGTTDLEILSQRANAVKAFALGNEDLRKNVKKILHTFAQYEADLLTRWSSTEKQTITNELEGASHQNKFLGSLWLGQQLTKLARFGWGTVEWNSRYTARVVVTALAGYAYNKSHSLIQKSMPVLAAVSSYFALGQLADYAHAQNNTKLSQEAILNKTITGFKELVKATQKIIAEYELYGKPEQTPASVRKISNMLDAVAQLQKEIDALVAQSATLEAAKKIDDNIDRVKSMLLFVSEIDSYLSMARHYREHRDRTKERRLIAEQDNKREDKSRNKSGELVTVCFATFDTTSTSPHVKAEGFWNPIIPYQHAVTNTIEVGGNPENPRHIVITGPNAGGKSMSMRGLINQMILSHAYQMAWAEKFETSPFKLVVGQLTNVDDPSAGKSKLQTEVINMRSILERINFLSAEKNEFAFVVTDELFTGTEAEIAADISLVLSQVFGEKQNVSYVLATHSKALTSLEAITNGLFKNYCVEAHVTKDPTGNAVTYPYKLIPGVGNENVALDIILLQMKNYKMDNDVLYARLLELQKSLREKKEQELRNRITTAAAAA